MNLSEIYANRANMRIKLNKDPERGNQPTTELMQERISKTGAKPELFLITYFGFFLFASACLFVRTRKPRKNHTLCIYRFLSTRLFRSVRIAFFSLGRRAVVVNVVALNRVNISQRHTSTAAHTLCAYA